MSPVQSNKRAILTGAGFSKNFGGFLADEFNDRILSKSEIRYRESLWSLILEEQNFEQALIIARDPKSGFHPADQKLLEESVREIFYDQDDLMRRSPNPVEQVVNFARLERLIKRLESTGPTGHLFTLNQDLFIERTLLNSLPTQPPQIPGIPAIIPAFRTEMGRCDRTDLSKCAPIDDSSDAVSRISFEGRMNYIKLHGSFNWRTGPDDNLLIIGGNKQSAIETSPILTRYLEEFRAVCNAGCTRLLVIGYSFSDQHINEVLATAILSQSLEMWVWDVMSKSQLLDRFQDPQKVPHGYVLTDGVKGFIRGPMSDYLLPSDVMDAKFDQRIEEFFDSPGFDSQVVAVPPPWAR